MQKIVACFLLLFSFFLSLPAAAHDKITVPRTQWNQLRDNNIVLLRQLTELELHIKMLKTPSTELQTQLAEAKRQLIESQSRLTVLSKKLENVDASQKAANESLTKLKTQIEIEQKKAEYDERRLKLQRNIACLIAVCLLIKN